MKDYTFKPSVDETQEFIEIANDFSNPLDLVREATCNSCDANPKRIKLTFEVEETFGERDLKITVEDDGDGMKCGRIEFFL